MYAGMFTGPSPIRLLYFDLLLVRFAMECVLLEYLCPFMYLKGEKAGFVSFRHPNCQTVV